MKRRDFIAVVGGTFAVSPPAVRAQRQTLPVIGFLHPATAVNYAPYVAAFRQGLSEQGYVEGRNVAIEFRWAEDQNDRLPTMAAELASRRVAVIVTGGSTAAIAAKRATSTIPIVFSAGTDPIGGGLVASFNRPGGNATGIIQFNDELLTKRLEMLHEMVPKAAVIGVLVDFASVTGSQRAAAAQAAGRTMGQQVRVFNLTSPDQFDGAFATMARDGVGALLVPNATLFTNGRDRLVALAARYSIPAGYEFREFVESGGLFSYGSSQAYSYQQVGIYTGRILKGEKPADLPVLRPTRFEFVLNLKTAKTLGLDIPLKLHAFADEVFE